MYIYLYICRHLIYVYILHTCVYVYTSIHYIIHTDVQSKVQPCFMCGWHVFSLPKFPSRQWRPKTWAFPPYSCCDLTVHLIGKFDWLQKQLKILQWSIPESWQHHPIRQVLQVHLLDMLLPHKIADLTEDIFTGPNLLTRDTSSAWWFQSKYSWSFKAGLKDSCNSLSQRAMKLKSKLYFST